MTGEPTTGASAGDGGSERWQELEADLDAQAAAAALAERRVEAADRGRTELAAVRLVDRLRAGFGREVVVAARGCGPVRGVVAAVGSDCVQVVEGSRETVLAVVAVLSITGLGPAAVNAAATPVVERRLGMASVLRRFARDRSAVRVMLDTGDVLHGTIDAVGADHLDLAEHAPDQPRRRSAVLERRVLPLTAVAAVARG